MVIINGEPKDAAGMTVTELLDSMKLLPERTAVMIESDILPKADYCRCLKDGETVEIIGFVGGG
ncbi:MAG: sulfur carrier protein ThiS [Oscillospiraceae bacterium]|nr:sulfur carrier protein ThiS [Oscillospiraceae bacterium]